MAIDTSLVPGKNARIYVSTDGVTSGAVLLRSMNSITNRVDTSTDTTATFDDDPAPTTSTTGSDTYAIGGLFRAGDPGQKLVRDNRAAGANIYVHVYPDGDVGWKQQVSLGGGEWGASPGPLQPWSFDCSSLGSKVADTRTGYAGTKSAYTI